VNPFTRRASAPRSAPVAQFLLASAGAFLVELGLYLCPLGPLLGDRGLSPTLVGPLAMVPHVIVLSLNLLAAKLTPLTGATARRD
jgi:hypothetical protein